MLKLADISLIFIKPSPRDVKDLATSTFTGHIIEKKVFGLIVERMNHSCEKIQIRLSKFLVPIMKYFRSLSASLCKMLTGEI